MSQNPISLIFPHESKNVKTDFHRYENKEANQILDDLKLNYDPQDIEEIIFEDLDIPEISNDLRKKLEEFANLHSLGFNRCGLQTLANVPRLSQLQRFSADGNHLRIKCLGYLRKYPSLKSLSLMCNQIESLDKSALIKFLTQTSIQQLNLYGNPIQGYASELFEHVPNLYVIDNLLPTGEQVFYEVESQH